MGPTIRKMLNTIDDNSRKITSLIRLNDRQIARGGGDTRIIIWDLSSGICLHSLIGHNAAVETLLKLSKTQLASGGGYEGLIKIWDLPTEIR